MTAVTAAAILAPMPVMPSVASPTVAFVGQSVYFSAHLPALPGCVFKEYIHQTTPLPDLADADYDVLYFFRGEYLPATFLKSLKGVKVCLSTEPMPRRLAGGRIETSPDRDARFAEFKRARGKFDRVYHFDPASVSYLNANGFDVDGIFRLPVQTRIYQPAWKTPKLWDVFMFGKDTEHRRALANPLKHALGERFCHATHGFVGAEFVRLAQRAKIGLNLHVDTLPSTEPRLYLYAACGLLVISEPLSDNSLLRAGEHYIEVQDEHELREACYYYAAHDRERERIARAAHAQVKQNLAADRVWPEFTADLLRPALTIRSWPAAVTTAPVTHELPAPKIAVYTALYGDYLALSAVPDLGVPCIAFCDHAYPGRGWDLRVMPRPEAHPRLQAKWFKLHPHLCLADFDISIWIDAGVAVLDPKFPWKLAAWLKGSATVFFPHRERTTLTQELAAHLALPKYAGVPVSAQVAHYARQGFPDNVGLLECTVIARYHHDLRAVKLNEKWWEHNLRWTFADQISLPYVLWQLGGDQRAGVTRLPFPINKQPWLKWEGSRPDK